MDVIITAMPTERMDKMQENDKRQQEVQESVQEYHEDENAIDLMMPSGVLKNTGRNSLCWL